MASAALRDTRRRIKSVEATKKITRAMELIAASRIPKAQARVMGSKPYTEKLIEVIKNVDGRTQFLQMFTHLPWPIRDRDTVMKRSVQVLRPGSEFRIRYECAPSLRKELRQSMRVTTCDSHFTLKGVDVDKTYVDYQVYLDPGGGLPSWGIRYLEKRVTVDTIYKLQRQVRRTPGQYQDVIRRWANEK